MKWQILFFNKKVEKETLEFPPKILEIRAKGKEGIGRSIFCYQKGRKIVILHSFVKKSQKTPKKDLEIALQRKKELENGNF